MWSSQPYLVRGRKLGLSPELLQEAVKQSRRLAQRHPQPLPVLLTLCHLAKRTGVPYSSLRAYVSRQAVEPYRRFRIRKRSGGVRRICVPEPTLGAIQTWIAEHILQRAQVHRASHAFKKGDSIVRCAEQHSGARWLVKMDIADFFGSVSEIDVHRVFVGLGYNPLVSFELARICTELPSRSDKYALSSWQCRYARRGIPAYGQQYIGRLPQGAPSSPMLANLTMVATDQKLEEIALKAGLLYTRYSDDLTFSTAGDFDKGRAYGLIEEVAAVLKSRGLFPNRAKTVIVHPGARRLVLGLLVDGDAPRLTRVFRDRLRQHLYYLEKLGIAAHVQARAFESAGGLYRHLRGLIDYANSVDPTYAGPLLARLEALPWAR
ncbi:reverse transcriptase family protein [Pelomonas sp. CA6]|uniref:reverse transcriptase family protein n=1 Tax=Pelomonas sp. CA6 TaxID=2907999 RepID=UPI001F4C4920|nr:reverse transcriptase family protein [Pelomonas sp. CA6]MCH7345388.1 reverse transcriptase family protein [Pelomonas sp. CA6]